MFFSTFNFSLLPNTYNFVADMSLKKTVKCRKCGYEADVYEGKGFFGQHITTVMCPDCHSLQNIVVGGMIGRMARSFSSEVGRLCPMCGSENIGIWDNHTCPKCGGEMVFTDDEEFWT